MERSKQTRLILILAILQVLSSTYFFRIPHFYEVNSILFLISGLSISFILLKIPVLSLSHSWNYSKGRNLVLKIISIAILLPLSYVLCRRILDGTPVDIQHADMLPVIKLMGERFLNGQWYSVYEPIPEIWNGFQPNYPPVLWMSFLPALIFDFDPRWVTVGGIWLTTLLCILPLRFSDKQQKLFSFLLIAALLVLLGWLHTDQVNNVIRLTEEGVIFFYYALLCYAVVSGNAWLIGICTALCLLSRFSIAGWLPCVAIYFLAEKKYSALLKSFAGGSLVILALLVLPFGWKTIQLFISTPEVYIDHARVVWERNPEFLRESLGMAKFFGKDHVTALHSSLILLSFLAPVLFCLYYLWLKRRRTVNNFLPASLILSLTVFYNFIDVSYLYLFYTPVFAGLVMAAFAVSTQADEKENLSISSR